MWLQYQNKNQSLIFQFNFKKFELIEPLDLQLQTFICNNFSMHLVINCWTNLITFTNEFNCITSDIQLYHFSNLQKRNKKTKESISNCKNVVLHAFVTHITWILIRVCSRPFRVTFNTRFQKPLIAESQYITIKPAIHTRKALIWLSS